MRSSCHRDVTTAGHHSVAGYHGEAASTLWSATVGDAADGRPLCFSLMFHFYSLTSSLPHYFTFFPSLVSRLLPSGTRSSLLIDFLPPKLQDEEQLSLRHLLKPLPTHKQHYAYCLKHRETLKKRWMHGITRG